MGDIHYFTVDGKETTEGAEDSVVQYTEADATKRGLKFKASGETTPEPMSMADKAALAAEDGSAKKPTPVTAKGLTEADAQPAKK